MTGMSEMLVSSQEDIANPQDMTVFAVEIRGRPEEFVSFRALCKVQSIVTARICAESCDCLGTLQQ